MTKSILLFLVITLAGCATGRSYHNSDNMWKLGYSDTQLNERIYRVSYADTVSLKVSVMTLRS